MLAIRFIGSFRKYLNKDHIQMMVNAFVMSRLGYCKSFFCGLPKREIDHRYPKVTSENHCCVTG